MIEKDFTVKLKNCYVYLHLIKSTGEVFYVGKGTRYRWSATNRSHQWFDKSRGSQVSCRIIGNNLTDNEAFLLEKKVINLLGRENLVNLTDGGEGCNGAKVSELTKKRLSIIQTANSFQRTGHLRKKIIMDNSVCFNGVKEAARYLNIKSSNHISRVASGKSLSYLGHLFRWADMSESNFNEMQDFIKKEVFSKIREGAMNARAKETVTRVCMNDTVSFSSVKNASTYMVELGLAKNIVSAKATINSALRKETKLAFGFSWFKIENKG